eukprot:scaffold78403_cov30-Tisochrysis_lutea.AAC.2
MDGRIQGPDNLGKYRTLVGLGGASTLSFALAASSSPISRRVSASISSATVKEIPGNLALSKCKSTGSPNEWMPHSKIDESGSGSSPVRSVTTFSKVPRAVLFAELRDMVVSILAARPIAAFHQRIN